jgi:uncharacterized protein YggE
MKYRNTLVISLLLAFGSLNLSAQVGGNQIYQNQSNGYNNSYTNYNRTPVETQSIYTTDSTLVVTSKVLLIKKAERYLITVGVNQNAKTVNEANQKITTRINNTIKKVKLLGISAEDCYVDFISQTKTYDHKIVEREIIEFFDGFNLRKNIAFETSDLSLIDRVIEACAEAEIYDIIKVDYISADLETVNNTLFDEAFKIANKKKSRFQKHSSIQLSGSYKLAIENFKTYYPKNLYKQYSEAFETSTVNTYNSSYITKTVRKEKTFYYEGIETEMGADKIVDDISPIIGIQYVITIVVIYDLKK